jgi:hypothetical protein
MKSQALQHRRPAPQVASVTVQLRCAWVQGEQRHQYQPSRCPACHENAGSDSRVGLCLRRHRLLDVVVTIECKLIECGVGRSDIGWCFLDILKLAVQLTTSGMTAVPVLIMATGYYCQPDRMHGLQSCNCVPCFE